MISINQLDAQGFVKERCKTDIIMQSIYQSEPAYYESVLQSFKKFASIAPKSKSSIITIPIHVIIVHPAGQPIGSGDNLSLEHIESQITVLNEDFRRNNSDAADMPPEFPGDDSEIEFCIASSDPNGNPTDGVTRYIFSGNFDDNEFMIKNATKWPREDYLNIWVAGNIGGLLGYAYIPSTTNLPNPTLDGVVCWTPAFGGPGYATDNTYNLGRTTTHEVGHYLGLNHVWGGGNGGCSQDDGIADTPLQNEEYFGCPNHPSPSCGSNDMFMNYMDYVDDACMNSYSTLQGNYMQLILNTSRSSLLNAANTNCTFGPPLSGVILDQSDLACNGDFSGWIEVEATGGTSPYTFSLNNGTPQSSGLFTGLSAGNYEIVIQDSNGNTFSISTDLSEPSPLILNNDLVQNVSCFSGNDGVILVSASGGTAGYLFKLNNGNYQSSGYFPNLEAGNYLVYVQDANLCVKLLAIQVVEPDQLLVYITGQEDVDCFGSSSGSVNINGIGGNGGYLYSFDGSPYSNQTEYSELDAGDYTVLIIDSKNCTNSMIVTINEPDELVLSASEIVNPTCGGTTDGSVDLAGAGGVEPYVYSINGTSYQSSNQFINLPSGNHTFFIKDHQNCVDSLEVILINEGDIEMDITLLNAIDCPGEPDGSIIIHASGGLPSYLYSLDGTNFQSDSLFQNLTAGSYTIIVQDQNDCSSMDEFSINEPENFAVESANVVDEDCNASNGSISIQIVGGTGDIDYSIDGGNFLEQGEFTDLQNGFYTIYVIDENNCIWSQDYEVGEQSNLNLNLVNLENVNCFGDDNGLIEGTASNAIGNVMYSLDNIVFQSSGIFENLNAGMYTIYAMDDAGCVDQLSLEIMQNSALEIIENVTTDADCGLENGTANFTATGGVAPYMYSINGIEYFSSGSFEGLTAGIHTIFVHDSNNCNTNSNFEIDQLSNLTILSIVQLNPLCFGDQNGDILINASGGSGALSFSIDGTVFYSNNYFSQLGAGTFVVTVMDENNCLDEQLIELVDPEPLLIESQNNLTYDCEGELTGDYVFLISGGTLPYSSTMNGENVESPVSAFFFTIPGNYSLAVSDDHGCTLPSIELNVEEYIELKGSIVDIIHDSGGGNGSVLLKAEGGSEPYKFSQDSIEYFSNPFINNLTEGIYTFFVMDSQGCTDEVEVSILSSSLLDYDEGQFKIYPNPFDDLLNIESIKQIDLQTCKVEMKMMNGKKIAVNYSIENNKIQINVLDDLDSGMYLVSITDSSKHYTKLVIKSK